MENLPKIDLSTFCLSISSAVFHHLGMNEDQSEVNLPLARQNIDILELIYEKTKSNRTKDEDDLLQHLLFETRMRFVEVKEKK